MAKAYLLASASFALLATVPAHAQDSTPAAPTESTSSTARTGAVEDADVGEIIVTATRRAEALSDVPIAVSAVTAESLQNSGATDIRQLNQLAPSLLVSSTGSEANGSARIRGIGTVGDNPGLESSVAVFIDGVYRSRSGIGLNELGEIDRVEVLRGPQGTLFGRNASAGLINIVSKKPSFDLGGFAEATYGNYDFLRLAGGVTGPVAGDTIAARLDAVYVQRDGFYEIVNAANGTEDRVNDRDRYFLRGQLLFAPNDDLEVRVIGDYTNRKESCCAAEYKYTAEAFDPTPGVPGDVAFRQNRVVDILNSFNANNFPAGGQFDRRIAVTPGRTYGGKTTDGGISAEANYDFGGATLTSITAYRQYKSGQASDTDYSVADLLYRPNDGTAYRQFKTFSQELRLNGSLFDDRLDWLVGGYFADEKLRTRDNLKFGADYGQFLACRLVASVSPAAALRDPDRDADGCLSPVGAGTLLAAFSGANAAGGTDGSQLVAAFQRLSSVGNVGFQTSNFDQRSRNYAFFTHNIFDITDTLSLTLGARYTNEEKKLSASFNSNNTACPAQQAATLPAIAGSGNATARALLGGAVQFACLFNLSSQLNTLRLADELKDDQITGTAVLSWKPTPDLLTYASYSKGYKAGGFNLDPSALGSPLGPQVPANVVNLRFQPEKVDAYEIGIKFNGRRFNLNVAAFRQEFESFQLNTFNGLFFLVQNVNGCDNLVGGSGADEDALGTTGTCAAGDVGPGVISEGVELEASLFPAPDLAITAGLTYADTRYEKDLVGNIQGTQPLAAELFLLPGSNLSNAPKYAVTSSIAWTPEVGSTGLSGLFYVDTRMTSDFNTGSDLFPEKAQDGFVTVNARIGLRGPDERWAVELWAQNLLDTEYDQVAFNSPLQAAGAGTSRSVIELNQPFAGQLFSAFLSEPRTYGVTVRTRF